MALRIVGSLDRFDDQRDGLMSVRGMDWGRTDHHRADIHDFFQRRCVVELESESLDHRYRKWLSTP